MADNSFRLSLVKNGTQNARWKLGDVVDFEILRDRLTLWKKVWKDSVQDRVEEVKPKTEKERRRVGFLLMLRAMRERDELSAESHLGTQVMSVARLIEVGVGVCMFLLGVALVRGMLSPYVYAEVSKVSGLEMVSARGFNIWIFLALTLGLQWLVLISTLIGYLFWGRWPGSLSLLQRGVAWVIKKWAGFRPGEVSWLKLFGATGFKLWAWRLTRILQSGGVGYNLGLLAGLFGCLWFLNVGFYWETSLPQFGEQSLKRVTQVLSIPVGGDLVSVAEVEMANLEAKHEAASGEDVIHSMPARMRVNLSWGFFFFFALAAWGLLPRVLLWGGAWWMERRMLVGMDFQEARHRSLWRDVTRVARGEVVSAPADGVVVLDIGGLDVTTESVRPYFLQVLRVNPESRYSLGTLDVDGERRALDAARQAALGVVFLVEGWNLSPKQMVVYHQKVRLAIGEAPMIRYLVLDATDEEISQWISFVHGLKDSESEVFRYE